MPVAVQMPRQKEKRDPLETIARGLQIAGSIYGLKEASQKAELLKSEAARKAEVEGLELENKKDSRSGVLSAEKLFDKQSSYDSVNPGTAGALHYQVRKGDKLEDVYLKPKPPIGDPNLKDLRAQILEMQLAEAQRKSSEVSGPQALAATYGRRMEKADQVMRELEEKGYDRSNTVNAAFESMLPEALLNENRKKQNQAEDNFLNAVLRRESGAAISDSERESGSKQYFNRSGDSAEVKLQKAQNRAQAVLGLKTESGRAWDQIPQAPTPQVANNQGGGPSLGSVLRPPQANASPGPKPGVVENGYRFKGGNPADQKNWEKVK